MYTLARMAVAATAALLTVTACTAEAPPAGEGPRIVTAFYPLQWATEAVLGGTAAQVETLTAPGAEAHDLELSPKQMTSLANADLVIYLGGFQPGVDKAIEQSGVRATLDVADRVDLLSATGGGHDHDEEETQEHVEAEGAFDPHFWQDPSRMVMLVDAVAARLGEVDPTNADDYRASAVKVTADLTALDSEYRQALADCVRREFITTHAAFQYLAQRYRLEEIGISGVNPDAEPSPARIKAVQDEAKRHGVTTIFFETLTADAVAASIAGDLGLKTAVLDPLEGVTDKSPGEDYPSIMRANLLALVDANECD